MCGLDTSGPGYWSLWGFVRSVMNHRVQQVLCSTEEPGFDSRGGKRSFSSLQSADRHWGRPSHQANWKTIVFLLCLKPHYISVPFGLILSVRGRLLRRQRNDWQITSDFLWLRIKKAAVCVWSADYVVLTNPKEHRLQEVAVTFL